MHSPGYGSQDRSAIRRPVQWAPLRRLLVLALTVLLVGCLAAAPAGRSRNAILICMDTVRYDAWELVRKYAPPPPDSGWQRAIHLQRVQSTAPWTLPAVASVFTGLYPNTLGAGVFDSEIADFSQERPAVLADAEFVTLAETLRDAGFATASFTASRMFQWAGFRQGFDEEFAVGGVNSRHKIVRDVTSWLDRNTGEASDRRFFLYLHFMEAHRHPRHVGAKRLAARMAETPPALIEAARAAAPGGSCTKAGADCDRWLHYVVAVLVIRNAISELLSDLEARGLLSETSIALFADHGEEFFDHLELSRSRGLDPRGQYGVGHGHTLFQEQLHVPVVLWHPGLSPRDVDAPVSLADLTATLLEWLAVEAPSGQGVALGPVLAGGDFDPERPLFSSAVAFGPRREAVLKGDRKLLSGGGSAPDLTFELDGDPREERPLGRAAEDLDSLLDGYRRQRSAVRPAAPIDAETLRELQALGYLEKAQPTPDAPEPE